MRNTMKPFLDGALQGYIIGVITAVIAIAIVALIGGYK
jgi:hypothetical protein